MATLCLLFIILKFSFILEIRDATGIMKRYNGFISRKWTQTEAWLPCFSSIITCENNARINITTATWNTNETPVYVAGESRWSFQLSLDRWEVEASNSTGINILWLPQHMAASSMSRGQRWDFLQVAEFYARGHVHLPSTCLPTACLWLGPEEAGNLKKG